MRFDQEGIADVTSESATVSWGHAGERSRLEFSGGATVADQEERETFFSGSATYHQRLGRSAEVGGGWRRSLSADIGNDGAAIGDSLFVTLSGRAGEHVSLMVSADYGTRDSTAGADAVNLDLWGGTFRTRISMGRRWGLVAGANIRRQEAVQQEIGSTSVNNYWLGINCRAF